MSELPSVTEFSQDITDAKAPAPLPIKDYNGEIRMAKNTTSKS